MPNLSHKNVSAFLFDPTNKGIYNIDQCVTDSTTSNRYLVVTKDGKKSIYFNKESLSHCITDVWYIEDTTNGIIIEPAASKWLKLPVLPVSELTIRFPSVPA